MKQRALLLALSVALGACSESAESPARAPLIYVDAVAAAGGSGAADSPFSTVAAAVASAQAGDTIVLAAGTYPEAIRLEEGHGIAEVRGAGPDLTLISPDAGRGVIVVGGKVTISSLMVTGAESAGLSGRDVELLLRDVHVQATQRVDRAGDGNGGGHGVQVTDAKSVELIRCQLSNNHGAGLMISGVGLVTLDDPDTTTMPADAADGSRNPGFAPASVVSHNKGGGVAIVNPPAASAGSAHFVVRRTLIEGNDGFGLASYGVGGEVHASAVIGTRRPPSADYADGVSLLEGVDPAAAATVVVAATTLLADNEAAGARVAGHGHLRIAGVLRGNHKGGAWAVGPAATLSVEASALLVANKGIGAGAAAGAMLWVQGARIGATEAVYAVAPTGGIPELIADGVVIASGARARIADANLSDNQDAGLLLIEPALLAGGFVDVQVKGCTFGASEVGIAVNVLAAGQVSAAQAAGWQADNTFVGVKKAVALDTKLNTQRIPGPK